jgi:hypothetical protein
MRKHAASSSVVLALAFALLATQPAAAENEPADPALVAAIQKLLRAYPPDKYVITIFKPQVTPTTKLLQSLPKGRPTYTNFRNALLARLERADQAAKKIRWRDIQRDGKQGRGYVQKERSGR